MSDEREQVRTTLAWTAGIFGWVLFLAAVLVAFGIQRSADRKIEALVSQIAEGRRANEEQSQSIGEKTQMLKQTEEQVAEFVALADEQFPHAAREARLPSLYANLTAVIDAERSSLRRRYLDAEDIKRIEALLRQAPVLEVEIGGMSNDPESLSIARQLITAFSEAGFHVRKLVEYTTSPIKLPGLSIYSKPRFDETMGPVVAEIFKCVSQPRIQWVSKELAGPSQTGEPDPDIKIVFGPK